MATEDPQAAWSAFYARKKEERLREADAMWRRMQQEGIGADDVLALDFVHFGAERDRVEALAAQLGENYQVKAVPAASPGYWQAEGTTRPYGLSLQDGQLVDWAGFMAEVAHSHGCVFSTWTVEAPGLGKRWSSEDFGD